MPSILPRIGKKCACLDLVARLGGRREKAGALEAQYCEAVRGQGIYRDLVARTSPKETMTGILHHNHGVLLPFFSPGREDKVGKALDSIGIAEA